VPIAAGRRTPTETYGSLVNLTNRMNFFVVNCWQEDNKRAEKKAIYAEIGQNTDELQTKRKTRWRHKKKQSSGDSAGQQH